MSARQIGYLILYVVLGSIVLYCLWLSAYALTELIYSLRERRRDK